MRYRQCYVGTNILERNTVGAVLREAAGERREVVGRLAGRPRPSQSAGVGGSIAHCTLHCILLLQKILSFDGVSSLTGDCDEVERLARLRGWEVVTSREGEKSLVMQLSEEESEGEEDEYNVVLEDKLMSEEEFDEEWS